MLTFICWSRPNRTDATIPIFIINVCKETCAQTCIILYIYIYELEFAFKPLSQLWSDNLSGDASIRVPNICLRVCNKSFSCVSVVSGHLQTTSNTATGCPIGENMPCHLEYTIYIYSYTVAASLCNEKIDFSRPTQKHNSMMCTQPFILNRLFTWFD